MVRKKHQSKRISASKRYKIEANVKEHHRKLRKEAKLHPTSNKFKKDPGIPNLFPFKDKILKEAEEHKKRIEDEKEKQRELRQKLHNKNRNLSSDQVGLLALAASANKRSGDFENRQSQAGDGEHIRDNSKKAFYREFKKVVEQADVILEVLDARDPIGCRSKQVEELILNAGSDKKIILVLNKIDLVPREVVEKWMKYLRGEFPCVAFKASTQTQKKHLGHSSASTSSDGALSSSECLGADSLMKLLKNYCRNANIKSSISVGVIGFPNVGKSSLINSLKRSKACNVGATPGVTKITQEVHLDKQIKLIDCPGIVFASGNSQKDVLLLRNCLKVEQIEDPVGAVDLLLKRCNQEQILAIYSVQKYTTTNEFLGHLARQRGKLKKSGVPDLEAVSKIILKDWNTGKIPYYVQPPKDDRMLSASIVNKFASEFSVDEIESEQAQVLSSINDSTKFSLKAVSLANNDHQIELDQDIGASEGMDEDYDDFAEDDDEEEEGDDDEAPELVPIQPVPAFEVTKKQKQKLTKSDKPLKPQRFIVGESELNAQANKQLKMLQKQIKKQKKKSAEREDEDEEGNDSYNFATDFVQMDQDSDGWEDVEDDD